MRGFSSYRLCEKQIAETSFGGLFLAERKGFEFSPAGSVRVGSDLPPAGHSLPTRSNPIREKQNRRPAGVCFVCRTRIIAENRCQLSSERRRKHRPHTHGHSGISHFLSLQSHITQQSKWIFTICIFIIPSPTFARKRKKPLTDGSRRSL